MLRFSSLKSCWRGWLRRGLQGACWVSISQVPLCSCPELRLWALQWLRPWTALTSLASQLDREITGHHDCTSQLLPQREGDLLHLSLRPELIFSLAESDTSSCSVTRALLCPPWPCAHGMAQSRNVTSTAGQDSSSTARQLLELSNKGNSTSKSS